MQHAYDGRIYALLIDPGLTKLREIVASSIPQDSRVLDVCCGTGALARRLAPQCSSVLGIDLSPRMIAYAQRSNGHLDNVSFRTANAAQPDINDTFDVATLIMGLHEMPHDLRTDVLPALSRIAERIIVVDFVPRLPWNLLGLLNRFIEISAGRSHFAGFRDWCRRGGLAPLIAGAGLVVERESILHGGTLVICTLKRK